MQVGLSEWQRQAILTIWAGYGNASLAENEVLRPLHFLLAHAKPNRFDAMLDWLLRNAITGAKFVEWYNDACHGSNLAFWKELTRRIEREKYARPLTLERDAR